MTITQYLAYSTIRIESTNQNGQTITGTGYFMNFKIDREKDTAKPVIITNKHVIKNADIGKLIFTTKNTAGRPQDKVHFPVKIEHFESRWVQHPDDNVDLCAFPIAGVYAVAKQQNIELYYSALEPNMIPSEEQIELFSGIENITMVGYPNGLWDRTNNKPIFRQGVTATHPKFDYNDKKEFLIDIASFPGSSGSPVFIVNENGYHNGKNTFVMGSRFFLMGTLYAGPMQTANGDIKIINVPTAQKAIINTQIPINLGFVIKSSRLLELENCF